MGILPPLHAHVPQISHSPRIPHIHLSLSPLLGMSTTVFAILEGGPIIPPRDRKVQQRVVARPCRMGHNPVKQFPRHHGQYRLQEVNTSFRHAQANSMTNTLSSPSQSLQFLDPICMALAHELRIEHFFQQAHRLPLALPRACSRPTLRPGLHQHGPRSQVFRGFGMYFVPRSAINISSEVQGDMYSALFAAAGPAVKRLNSSSCTGIDSSPSPSSHSSFPVSSPLSFKPRTFIVSFPIAPTPSTSPLLARSVRGGAKNGVVATSLASSEFPPAKRHRQDQVPQVRIPKHAAPLRFAPQTSRPSSRGFSRPGPPELIPFKTPHINCASTLSLARTCARSSAPWYR
ncbi:hypothetical protein MKZ38_009902 [Zalerion maritima]|uniref:Uncharacterized protein n=1 Tax=Zalerion maritima TaxID=339359 RepID=A0AAD5RJT7_9PEZI|nr:hypothetical protein MKZ38_009902 [Zalerion maritima]